MTELRYVWRPSMFAPKVVHLAREGAAARTSPEHPGERWVVAVCGQRTDPEAGESVDSVRCPECTAWDEQREATAKEPTPMSLFESRRAAEERDPFGDVQIEIDVDGRRVLSDPGPAIATNASWVRRNYPDMLADDGTLVLDSAGQYRYRPTGELPHGFTAYQRI